MQSNVNKILAAATATALFEIVTDDIPVEFKAFPALVVTDRIDRPETINSVQSVYFTNWEYEVHILVKKSAGWEDLEAKTTAFLKQLFDGTFQLLEQNHYDATELSGRQVLANSMRIAAINKQAYVA